MGTKILTAMTGAHEVDGTGPVTGSKLKAAVPGGQTLGALVTSPAEGLRAEERGAHREASGSPTATPDFLLTCVYSHIFMQSFHVILQESGIYF